MEQEQILSRLLSDISDEFDKSVGSFFYDIDKPVSEVMAETYKKAEDILKNGFALTATGKYLDVKVSEQGITRKLSKASRVEVVITGTPGRSIFIWQCLTSIYDFKIKIVDKIGNVVYNINRKRQDLKRLCQIICY